MHVELGKKGYRRSTIDYLASCTFAAYREKETKEKSHNKTVLALIQKCGLKISTAETIVEQMWN